MKAVFNGDGGIVLIPENSSDVIALRSWGARYPARTIHEGTQEPMSMIPADAISYVQRNEYDFH